MKSENQKIIDLLESMLRKAYYGELDAIAVATVEEQHTAGTAYVIGNNAAKLHYACAELTHRILMSGCNE